MKGILGRVMAPKNSSGDGNSQSTLAGYLADFARKTPMRNTAPTGQNPTFRASDSSQKGEGRC